MRNRADLLDPSDPTTLVRQEGPGRLSRGEVYARRVSLYRIHEPLPLLTAPVIVAAFDGWIDAAGAATACANHVAEDGDASRPSTSIR